MRRVSRDKWYTIAAALCFLVGMIRNFQLPDYASISKNKHQQEQYIQDAEVSDANNAVPPTSLIRNNAIQLNKPDMSFEPIYVGGCCGIGHRLSRNILTMTYANNHLQTVHVVWTDVSWSALFNDTDYVQARERMGKQEDNNYRNDYPADWYVENTTTSNKLIVESGTVFDRYADIHRQAMDLPVAQAMLRSMRDSLSPLVLSYLDSIRQQTHDRELDAAANNMIHVKVCAHVRQGNNETGDWAGKLWRHVDLPSLLNSTRDAMEDFVTTLGEGVPNNKNTHHSYQVSVFVASDSRDVRPWFESNVPKGWRVIMPDKELPKPETGVWFGEHGSKTSDVLNQTMKNEVMAEATSEIFALGECDALFIPNYSTFTLSSIILTRARKKPVFFRNQTGLGFREMSTLLKLQSTSARTTTSQQSKRTRSEESIVNRADHRQLMVETRNEMELVVCDDEL
jgi:hypothetical protein